MPKERTRPTVDLSYIFYNLRTVRDAKTRRSWQRRARIALDLLDFLTPAERHEITCVWSKQDCDKYDSPAMNKLQARLRGKPTPTRSRHDWEYKPASSAIRAGFDAHGQKIPRTKKPGLVTRLDFGPAANEPWPVLQLSLIG
ncbi:hypothetical protein [Rhodoferax sp. WC2427]|uniref:hypothetical protein n=1 Tax=Rhodoferax sp. WC2427 TaxID=3234144 RepID=UPI0034674A00